MKKLNVGVIGAGIFGCMAAIELAKSGMKVTLYEKQDEVFQGATSNTQNRLHLGLHYPRDLKTAEQSRIGFESFRSRFPMAVRLGFPNYYGIANSGSKVSAADFENFAMKAGIQIVSINAEDAAIPSFQHNQIERLWECSEGVIDIQVLKKLVKEEIEALKIQELYGSRVISIDRVANAWFVKTDSSGVISHDVVVRATYGLDTIRSSTVDLGQRLFEFHRTLILEADIRFPAFGMTIVDGDFLTILPKGFTDRFLLYGPSICVLDRHTGTSVPLNWETPHEEKLLVEAKLNLVQRFSEWFPTIRLSPDTSWHSTIRTVLPHMSSSDRRTSEVINHGAGFFDVWSGKIDHCLETSHKLRDQIIEGS